MAIDVRHPQYSDQIGNWKKIEDITRLKNLEEYLIELNKHDTSPENKERNAAYKERAVFYALTQQTVAGMLGTIFNKVPVFTPPTDLEYLAKNADGQGNSIYQQAQSVTDDVIRKSRAGLFVTFPETNGQISKADILSRKYVSTIQRIEPEQIINWATETVGAQTRLKLVVIEESRQTVVDYVVISETILRELYLDQGIFKVRIWTKPKDSKDWIAGPEFIPRDHSGNVWNEIPFQFVGSESNDVSVDLPNMLGMVKLNIAHYRNSADFEDSVWYAGQSQPWMSGVDQSHIDMMKSNNMYVGSRMMLAVPEGGNFGFASAVPNPVVRQAMMDKIDLMVGIGARMISQGSVAKTAEQTAGEREVQHSVLSLIAYNVSEAYEMCLKWVGKYMGSEIGDDVEFELNQEFVNPNASPAELKEIIAGFMAGAIPMTDYVTYMKKKGLFDDEKDAGEYGDVLPVGGKPDMGA